MKDGCCLLNTNSARIDHVGDSVMTTNNAGIDREALKRRVTGRHGMKAEPFHSNPRPKEKKRKHISSSPQQRHRTIDVEKMKEIRLQRAIVK